MKFKIMYYYHLLIVLIKKSPFKVLYLLISCILFHYAGTFEDYVVKIKVDKEIKVDNNWIYLYKSVSNNEIKYDLIQSEQRIELKDGQIIDKKYNDDNIILWVLFTIFALLVIVPTLSPNDSDINWELSDSKQMALGRMVKCEFQDGQFYYTIGDRLIGRTTDQFRNHNTVVDRLGIYCLNDVKICPKFESVSNKRNKLLDKLGVN